MLYSPSLCNSIARSGPNPPLLGPPVGDLGSSSSSCVPIASCLLWRHTCLLAPKLCVFGAALHRYQQQDLAQPPHFLRSALDRQQQELMAPAAVQVPELKGREGKKMQLRTMLDLSSPLFPFTKERRIENNKMFFTLLQGMCFVKFFF